MTEHLWVTASYLWIFYRTPPEDCLFHYTLLQDFSQHIQEKAISQHSCKKRKYRLETQAVLLIFLLELEISGVAVLSIHQNNKNGCSCHESLSENDFEVVLDSFCRYDYDAKISAAVPKIATDQKDYRKCSSALEFGE